MPPGLDLLLMFGALFAAMYFFMIRPQKKRAQEQQAVINALEPGSRVMLSSGIFATIKHLGEKQAIVELGPDVEITILRQAIMRPVKEDEDEFEYADEDEATDAATAEVPAATAPDLAWAEESFSRPSDAVSEPEAQKKPETPAKKDDERA